MTCVHVILNVHSHIKSKISYKSGAACYTIFDIVTKIFITAQLISYHMHILLFLLHKLINITPL